MTLLPQSSLPLNPLPFRPRPITDRAWWDQVASDPRWATWRTELLAEAEAVPAKPERLEASQLLSVLRANDRTANDRHVAVARRQLAVLVVRRCLLGLGDDDRLLDTLWAQLTEPSWTHASHLGPRDLPAHDRMVLDLMACEQAAFMAELREVLDPWLATQSATLSPRIVAEIDRQVLAPFAAGQHEGWDCAVPNNWIGVCGGSILCACESLAAQGLPRPAARARALDCVRRYVEGSFTPDGECDEGIGYWYYGMVTAALGWTRLDPAEWPAAARLARVADYPRRCHLFGDQFLSGNDSSMTGKAALSAVPWLGIGTGNAWLVEWARRAPAWGERHLGQVLRECAALEWLDPRPGAMAPPAEPVYLADQQAGVLTAGSAGRLVAALAGGTNAENHNHNDLGNVVLARDGRFVLPDLGAPRPYPGDFFGPRRYTYLAASSRGHSVPLVNGHEQREGADAAGTLLAWDGRRLRLELAAAYPAAAGLRSWIRELAVDGEALVLTDEFDLPAGGTVEHVLWSVAPFAANGLAITVSPAAAPADSTIDPRDHGAGHLFAAPLTRRAWTFVCAAGSLLRVTTRIVAA